MFPFPASCPAFSASAFRALFRRVVKGLLMLPLLSSLISHATPPGIVHWQEEVKLLDGRVITVTQQRHYVGDRWLRNPTTGIPREFWIRLTLPETGNQETTWNEKLLPTNLNVVNGKVYIVGTPWTRREFTMYNKPRPPWIGYVFDAGQWRRIPFADIPIDMYDANMSLHNPDMIARQRSGKVTLADKIKEQARPGLSKTYKRIDPEYIDPDDPFYTQRNSHLYPPPNNSKPLNSSPQEAPPEDPNKRN